MTRISDMAVFVTEQAASAEPPDRFTLTREDGGRVVVLDVIPAGDGATREIERLVREDVMQSVGLVHYRLLAEYGNGAVKAEKAYRRRGQAPETVVTQSSRGVDKTLVEMVSENFRDVQSHNSGLFDRYERIIAEQQGMIRRMSESMQEMVRNQGGEIEPGQRYVLDRLTTAAASALPALAPLLMQHMGAQKSSKPAEVSQGKYPGVRALLADLSDEEMTAIGRWLKDSGNMAEVFARLSESHQSAALQLLDEVGG